MDLPCPLAVSYIDMEPKPMGQGMRISLSNRLPALIESKRDPPLMRLTLSLPSLGLSFEIRTLPAGQQRYGFLTINSPSDYG